MGWNKNGVTGIMAQTYYEKNKEKILKRLKEKYKEDKEFREKVKTTYREKYHKDEEYKKATIERAKKRDRSVRKKDGAK